MKATRNGKIARLPHAIRRQLNRRLRDGEVGTELVAWLNTLPEVQTVMTAEFDGNPISKQNLSEWKQGGYAEWLTQQEAVEATERFSDNVDELNEAAKGPLGDKMAMWLAARYIKAADQLDRATDGEAPAWDRMRELGRDVAALRRGDHRAERLKLQRDRLNFGFKDDQARALELCLDDAKQYPDVMDGFKAVFGLLKARKAGR